MRGETCYLIRALRMWRMDEENHLQDFVRPLNSLEPYHDSHLCRKDFLDISDLPECGTLVLFHRLLQNILDYRHIFLCHPVYGLLCQNDRTGRLALADGWTSSYSLHPIPIQRHHQIPLLMPFLRDLTVHRSPGGLPLPHL